LYLNIFLAAPTSKTGFIIFDQPSAQAIPERYFDYNAFLLALSRKTGRDVDDCRFIGQDIALLASLLGNDYYPAIRGVGMSSLWQCYRQMIGRPKKTTTKESMKQDTSQNDSQDVLSGQLPLLYDAKRESVNWKNLKQLLKMVHATVTRPFKPLSTQLYRPGYEWIHNAQQETKCDQTEIPFSDPAIIKVVVSSDFAVQEASTNLNTFDSSESILTLDIASVQSSSEESICASEEETDVRDQESDGEDNAELQSNAPKLTTEQVQRVRSEASQVITTQLTHRLPPHPWRYLQGITWSLSLFLSGHPPSWLFEYNPASACSLDDIISYLESHPNGPGRFTYQNKERNSRTPSTKDALADTPVSATLSVALLVPAIEPCRKFIPNELYSQATLIPDAVVRFYKDAVDGKTVFAMSSAIGRILNSQPHADNQMEMDGVNTTKKDGEGETIVSWRFQRSQTMEVNDVPRVKFCDGGQPLELLPNRRGDFPLSCRYIHVPDTKSNRM
jgi:hypothetical protein